jgi:hypothetical protein
MGNATVTPLSTSAPIATKLLTRDEARRIAANIAHSTFDPSQNMSAAMPLTAAIFLAAVCIAFVGISHLGPFLPH